MSGVRWPVVGAFYGIAVAISWPIFFVRNHRPDVWAAWEAPWWLKAWAPALGPAVAATICLTLFRRVHRRRVTLAGTSWRRSALFVATPVVALTVVGTGGQTPHLSGFLVAWIFIVYGLLEELGWRGFLHDALRPLPELPRVMATGGLWGAWHFTTFIERGELADVLRGMGVMVSLWILGSWGMGRAVERTRSVVVAGMLHLLFNLAEGLTPATRLPVGLFLAAAWGALLVRWPAPPEGDVTPASSR